MDGYLVILDPMPLSCGEVPFYDGQPRKANGRFDFGKRINIAMTNGIKGKVTIAEAEKILTKTVNVTDPKGNNLIFDKHIIEKYRDGVGRSSSDNERLKSIGRAILAVQQANKGIEELEFHNPPQRQYLHKIGPRSAIVVYSETSGHVRGYIYNSHKNADKFLENKRGR